ncbi:MAG: Tn3 family transposase [Gloeotrichia echinulata GP01]
MDFFDNSYIINYSCHYSQVIYKFAKWFFFGGFGVIAKNDQIEQEKAIKYKDIVANAVIFQNVVDLTDKLLCI